MEQALDDIRTLLGRRHVFSTKQEYDKYWMKDIKFLGTRDFMGGQKKLRYCVVYWVIKGWGPEDVVESRSLSLASVIILWVTEEGQILSGSGDYDDSEL